MGLSWERGAGGERDVLRIMGELRRSWVRRFMRRRGRVRIVILVSGVLCFWL